MIKYKLNKCKGIGIAKDFKSCGELSYKRNKGLCQKCYRLFIFSGTKAGNEEKEKFFIKNKKRVERKQIEIKLEDKRKHQKAKIENKNIKTLIQEARRPFQKLIRIRDHGKKCICCEKPLPFNIGDYDGGHFWKAELYTGLIFHPDNVHGQLKYCNKYSHGNETGYSEGLKIRIGIDRYNNLLDSKNSLKSYNWERTKLIELKKYYSKELKLVEKGLKDVNDVDFSIGIVI